VLPAGEGVSYTLRILEIPAGYAGGPVPTVYARDGFDCAEAIIGEPDRITLMRGSPISDGLYAYTHVTLPPRGSCSVGGAATQDRVDDEHGPARLGAALDKIWFEPHHTGAAGAGDSRWCVVAASTRRSGRAIAVDLETDTAVGPLRRGAWAGPSRRLPTSVTLSGVLIALSLSQSSSSEPTAAGGGSGAHDPHTGFRIALSPGANVRTVDPTEGLPRRVLAVPRNANHRLSAAFLAGALAVMAFETGLVLAFDLRSGRAWGRFHARARIVSVAAATAPVQALFLGDSAGSLYRVTEAQFSKAP
jgi:hypothetical protein